MSADKNNSSRKDRVRDRSPDAARRHTVTVTTTRGGMTTVRRSRAASISGAFVGVNHGTLVQSVSGGRGSAAHVMHIGMRNNANAVGYAESVVFADAGDDSDSFDSGAEVSDDSSVERAKVRARERARRHHDRDRATVQTTAASIAPGGAPTVTISVGTGIGARIATLGGARIVNDFSGGGGDATVVTRTVRGNTIYNKF